MAQRWLILTLLYCGKKCRKVRGYAEIEKVITAIKNEQDGVDQKKSAA
jgi:hypothetical protein